MFCLAVVIGGLPASAAVRAKDGLIQIPGVPHVRQKPGFCGEACVEMVLRTLGRKGDQNWVFNQSGVDPALGRGCVTPELAAALKKIGFKVGEVWFTVYASQAADELETLWRAALADLRRGIPSIVCMHYDEQPGTTEHFRLVTGYDPASDEVIYHEPAEEGGANRRMKKARFIALWPLKYEKERWTIVRLRGEPGRLIEAVSGEGFTPADYAQHVMELRKKVPKGFSIVIEEPFVVIGDEAAPVVKRRAQETVGWAVALLEKDYFKREPLEILDVWLFRDAASYEKYTRAIFGHEPTTPFGFYSSADRALIMNIATGGGTLVHEIVHPFMRANFPKCPAWFNEGLASLYEQSCERDGHIKGLTNWRLAGLQKLIHEGAIPSFKTLLSTTDAEFYGSDRGDNYAQARYLCYYLQAEGLLGTFYRDFVANPKADPSGYETLKKTLGEKDMDVFQRKWQRFVLGLKFP